MKKYLAISLFTLFLIPSLISCKKEAAVQKPNDYAASIKDKTWWGTLTNAGETLQYYSVHFNADNTLLWSQLSGDYAGKWTIDGNKISLAFTSPSVTVNADITDDKLINIITNTANKINSCEPGNNAETSLDNTMWKGTNIVIKFKPGFLLDLELGAAKLYEDLKYFRVSNAIRFNAGVLTYKWFMVMNTASVMNGSNQFMPDPTLYRFQLSK